MAVKLGRNARIKLGTVEVARMTSMTLNRSNETIDITSFGDQDTKFKRGMRSWTISVAGHLDLDDASQKSLVDAAEEGAEVTDLRLYIDSTSYYYIDTVTDAEAAAFVDSYSWNTDNNSVVSFDMSFTVSGPLARYPSS